MTWVYGKIKKVIHWTDSLFSIIVQAPIEFFQSGQFSKISLKIRGERIQRAYSYVNAASDKKLELYLTNVQKGKISHILNHLQLGSKVMVTKYSRGFFVLEKVPDCETLWMLATGTAIGTYLSILRENNHLHRFQNLVLVHAVRFSYDLSYLQLMKKLKNYYKKKLRIQTIVSRENVPGTLKGRVTELIKDGTLEKVIGLSMEAKKSHVMLCGNPDMIKETQKLLEGTRNMRKNFIRSIGHISTEYYW